MYILLSETNAVYEIIPDIDPVFPGVPIEARYAPEFIKNLKYFPDSVEVEQNWVYDPETNTFSTPPEPPPEPEPEPSADDILSALLGLAD